MWATSSMNRYWSHLNFRLNKLQQILHHILKVGRIWFILHSNVSMVSILLFCSAIRVILSINIMEYDLFWTNNAILYGNKQLVVMVVISVKLRGLVFHLIQACDTEFILNRKITFWVWYNVIVIDNWNSISSILFTVSYDFGCYILKLLDRISFTTNIQLILYNV